MTALLAALEAEKVPNKALNCDIAVEAREFFTVPPVEADKFSEMMIEIRSCGFSAFTSVGREVSRPVALQMEPSLVQPNPYGSGTTQVVQQTQVQANNLPVNRIELKEGATVDDLVRSLQSIGATATDVISILQAMKQAGSLEGDLEVM